MSYFVYKYVYNNKIIYIGLTDDMKRRVYEHASGVGIESKFLPYLDNVEIYYHQCGNETEMRALESLLINHFKPGSEKPKLFWFIDKAKTFDGFSFPVE